MRRVRAPLVVLALSLLAPSADGAPDGAPVAAGLGTDARPLVVGTRRVPPFVIVDGDGSFSGISIDVWRQVAGLLELKYTMKEIPFSDIDATETNVIDVFVSRNISHIAEESYDMSHSFFTTGLAIATRQV